MRGRHAPNVKLCGGFLPVEATSVRWSRGNLSFSQSLHCQTLNSSKQFYSLMMGNGVPLSTAKQRIFNNAKSGNS